MKKVKVFIAPTASLLEKRINEFLITLPINIKTLFVQFSKHGAYFYALMLFEEETSKK